MEEGRQRGRKRKSERKCVKETKVSRLGEGRKRARL